MKELESGLNKILEEHQHESGLHVIGGRRRLVDRLMQFFEEFKPDNRTRDWAGSSTTRSRSRTATMKATSQKAKRITSTSISSTRIRVSSGGGRLVS